MQGSQFKHYILEMSHRHGSLIILQTLVAISNTMANAFALIYLYKNGADYQQCALFILVSVVMTTALIAFAARPIVRSFPASIETALVCLVVYYILLMFLKGWYLILIPPIFFGTYMATFWVPYNALIMHITSRKKRGAGVGAYFLIFPLVSTTAPLAGGLIIGISSYQVLFAIAAIIVTCNLVYISGFGVFKELRERIIIPELLQSMKVNLVGKLHVDLDMKGVSWRLKSSLFAEGIQDGIFWVLVPLISFEFAKSEVVLSGYLALFAFWGAVTTVALGYLSDRLKDRVSIVRIGAAFGAISTLYAAYSNGPGEYLSAMSLAYFWIAMIPSFLFTMLVDKLERFKKKGVLLREFYLSAGKCVGIAILIAVLVVGADPSICMTVAAVALASIIIVK
ncbi:MAG: MFS transporter [Thermoplasmata archaeon]|nr:MFS transporter [Thermoplasmata archaeon]